MNKVVRREVVGSANPFAKFFRELSQSVKGIATGILFIIISFVMIWFFANQKEHSKVIDALPLQTPEEVQGVNGMVKIHGVPDYSNVLVAPNTETDVLFYTLTKEDYAVREVEKTRTITEDGQEIRETYIEYEPSWKTTETRTEWSDFKMGPIGIVPNSAHLQVNTEKLYEYTEDLEYNEYLATEDLVEIPQKRRTTVTGVDADQEIIVVGTNSNDKISSGEEGTFFISNKSDSEFVQDQVSKERTTFWIMVAVSWFLMTMGFTMLLGPITKILNILPGVGSLVNSLLFIIFGIVSAVIIFVAYLGMKFWWLMLLLVLIGSGVYILTRVKRKPEEIKPIQGK
ncbi:hypothetical protein GF354_03235 [Candidatus Peregrinibacteria bacterium]|nr:hypothetical protein [Candidatus Peregrinibacteria bacterium]